MTFLSPFTLRNLLACCFKADTDGRRDWSLKRGVDDDDEDVAMGGTTGVDCDVDDVVVVVVVAAAVDDSSPSLMQSNGTLNCARSTMRNMRCGKRCLTSTSKSKRAHMWSITALNLN